LLSEAITATTFHTLPYTPFSKQAVSEEMHTLSNSQTPNFPGIKQPTTTRNYMQHRDATRFRVPRPNLFSQRFETMAAKDDDSIPSAYKYSWSKDSSQTLEDYLQKVGGNALESR
jgi:hypothetical protein